MEHSSCEELSWFLTPDFRGSQPMERFNRHKNEMSRIDCKGGVPTHQSCLNLSRLMEKLQADRVELLLNGKPWKVKKPKDLTKDKVCTTMTKKLKDGEIRVDQYLSRVVEIMGNYS